VATTLEVPIKLTFKAAAHKSILGLGDIVLPGMLIGWTLRFDLWLHYVRKIKYESTELKIVAKDETSGEVITKSDTKHREVKMPYVDVTGRWGDWFWSGGLTSFGRPLPMDLAATQFSKTYFYASLFGYCLGMLATLAMLLVYKRGQPALLYLVPGVLGAILITAFVRGEMKELWKYTEDGSLDTEDVVVDLDGQGQAVKSLGKLENGVVDMTKSKEEKEKDEKEKNEKIEKKDEDKAKAAEKKLHQVLLVSIEALEDSD
jgi:minor histocompatibility antigen H13